MRYTQKHSLKPKLTSLYKIRIATVKTRVAVWSLRRKCFTIIVEPPNDEVSSMSKHLGMYTQHMC